MRSVRTGPADDVASTDRSKVFSQYQNLHPETHIPSGRLENWRGPRTNSWPQSHSHSNTIIQTHNLPSPRSLVPASSRPPFGFPLFVIFSHPGCVPCVNPKLSSPVDSVEACTTQVVSVHHASDAKDATFWRWRLILGQIPMGSFRRRKPQKRHTVHMGFPRQGSIAHCIKDQ